jgi:hypothetical protein
MTPGISQEPWHLETKFQRLTPLVVGRYIADSIYRVDIWYIVSYRYRGNFIEKFDIFYIKVSKMYVEL